MRILAIDDNFGDEFGGAALFKARLAKIPHRVDSDEDEISEKIDAILRNQGYELVFAAGGDGALNAYHREGPFDLVLTDFVHPGPNGYELAKAIRTANPKQAIAVITAGVFETEGDELRLLGVPVVDKLAAMQSLSEFLEWAIAYNRKRLTTQ